MRKDVKLGLAIGAILLAVIIVWAAVPRHAPKNTGVALTGQTNSNTGSPSDQGSKPGDVPQPTPPTVPDQHPALPAPGPDGGAAAEVPKPPADAHTGTDWAAILRAPDDQLPALIGRTGVTPAVDQHPAGDLPPDDGGATATAGHDHGGMSPPLLLPPTTQQATGDTPSTHKVQPGETLAAIAKSVYGKSSMYLAIEKANPSINPNRLKVGTVLTLPSALQSEGAHGAGALTDDSAPAAPRHSRTEATIDPTTQYRVQSGDSLHRIAVKLYGNAARADELYTTNKDTIGDDPAKLKVGEILKLPEPPTATASR